MHKIINDKLIIAVLGLLIIVVSVLNHNYLEKELHKLQEQQAELTEELESLREIKKSLELELEELWEYEPEIHIEIEDIFPDYIVSKATITAYTLECGYPWDDGITYTGVEAEAYRTAAVDPNYIPLGSLLYVEGYGFFVAEDIGGAVKGWHVDLYVGEGEQAKRDAFEIGRRQAKVYVLT